MAATSKNDSLSRILGNAGWDGRTAGKANTAAIRQAWEMMQANPRAGLHIVGNNGIGKTMLARAMFPRYEQWLDMYRAGISAEVALHYSMSDPADVARLRGWEPDGYGQRRENVVLDDLGTEEVVVEYGQRVDVAAAFISRWYVWWQRGRVGRMILTTNLPGDGIVGRYGTRIADRLREMCVILGLEGASRRAAMGIAMAKRA